MAGAALIPEVPVVLTCQDNVFVVVPQSILIKESAVFKAELSTSWQHSENIDPDGGKSKEELSGI